MKKTLTLFMLILIVLVGCAKPPPTKAPAPPPAPAPAPPSPEEIAAEIRPILAPIQSSLQPGVGFVDEAKGQLIAGLNAARSKHSVTENGKMALSQIAREIEDMLKQATEMKKWRVVMACVDSYEVLDPNSPKMTRPRERAMLQINRPKVKVNGFFIDQARGNDTYVSLKITNNLTRKVHDVWARVGEEFDGLRLVKIIGAQQGVSLEYMAAPGDVFDVMKDQSKPRKAGS